MPFHRYGNERAFLDIDLLIVPKVREYYIMPKYLSPIKTIKDIDEKIINTNIKVLSPKIVLEGVSIIPLVVCATPTFWANDGNKAVPTITRIKPTISKET